MKEWKPGMGCSCPFWLDQVCLSLCPPCQVKPRSAIVACEPKSLWRRFLKWFAESDS